MTIDHDLRVAPPGWRVLITSDDTSTGVSAELRPLVGWVIRGYQTTPVTASADGVVPQAPDQTWTLLGPGERPAPSMQALVDRCRQLASARQEQDAAALLARFVEPSS
jgi:hypothetical protein